MADVSIWDGVGPPTHRRWQKDDIVFDKLGAPYRCIRGGTPGDWEAITFPGSGLPGGGTDNDVLTLVSGSPAWAAPSGASGPGSSVTRKFEIAFDTPGLTYQWFAVTGVNQGTKKFTIAGDHVAVVGPILVVVGSSGNDQTYTVASVVLDTGNTVIEVVQAIPDATADGDLGTNVGLELFQPAEGDVIVNRWVDVATVWDTGGVCIVSDGSVDGDGLADLSGAEWDLTAPNVALSNSHRSASYRDRIAQATWDDDTKPLLAFVNDNNDPAAAGLATIYVQYITAPA